MDDKEQKIQEGPVCVDPEQLSADVNIITDEPLPALKSEEDSLQIPGFLNGTDSAEDVPETPAEGSVTEGEPFVDLSDCVTEETPVADDTGKKKKSNTILSYLHDLVFGLVVILLVFMLVFRGVVVSGPSMKDTFLDGDYIILLSNVFYRNPQQGDIIVASKDSFRNGEPIIKRVIATEGQKVTIDFEAGIVYVDGKPLDEPYTKTPTNLHEGLDFKEYVVAEGCVFVMGDNRNDSKDSRSPEIGLIDCREIMGKALFLVLPGTDGGFEKRDFSRIGVLW